MDPDLPRESQFSAGSPGRELVFLLHGFGGRPLLMSRLARYLRRCNFTVRNWKYPSVREQIANNAERLHAEVERAAAEGGFTRVDFVTHSLGGIVVRRLLSQSSPAGIRRVVMLAPPNAGSHMARLGSIFLRGFCPVLREISDRQTRFVDEIIEPSDVEIGIIAGSGDWVVRQASTHLPCERDHIVLRGGHLSLPFLKSCVLQTEYFLRYGTFDHAAASRGTPRHTCPRISSIAPKF